MEFDLVDPYVDAFPHCIFVTFGQVLLLPRQLLLRRPLSRVVRVGDGGVQAVDDSWPQRYPPPQQQIRGVDRAAVSYQESVFSHHRPDARPPCLPSCSALVTPRAPHPRAIRPAHSFLVRDTTLPSVYYCNILPGTLHPCLSLPSCSLWSPPPPATPCTRYVSSTNEKP